MGVVLSQPAIVDNMMSVCGDDIKALFFEKLAEYSGDYLMALKYAYDESVADFDRIISQYNGITGWSDEFDPDATGRRCTGLSEAEMVSMLRSVVPDCFKVMCSTQGYSIEKSGDSTWIGYVRNATIEDAVETIMEESIRAGAETVFDPVTGLTKIKIVNGVGGAAGTIGSLGVSYFLLENSGYAPEDALKIAVGASVVSSLSAAVIATLPLNAVFPGLGVLVGVAVTALCDWVVEEVLNLPKEVQNFFVKNDDDGLKIFSVQTKVYDENTKVVEASYAMALTDEERNYVMGKIVAKNQDYDFNLIHIDGEVVEDGIVSEKETTYARLGAVRFSRVGNTLSLMAMGEDPIGFDWDEKFLFGAFSGYEEDINTRYDEIGTGFKIPAGSEIRDMDGNVLSLETILLQAKHWEDWRGENDFDLTTMDMGMRVDGLGGDDSISGSSHSDDLYGGDDNDTLRGNWGDDKLFGGDGNDFIYGGRDNDTLDGGAGNDWLEGGDGIDTYVLRATDGVNTIVDGYSKFEIHGNVSYDIVGSDLVIAVSDGDNVSVTTVKDWNGMSDIVENGISVRHVGGDVPRTYYVFDDLSDVTVVHATGYDNVLSLNGQMVRYATMSMEVVGNDLVMTMASETKTYQKIVWTGWADNPDSLLEITRNTAVSGGFTGMSHEEIVQMAVGSQNYYVGTGEPDTIVADQDHTALIKAGTKDDVITGSKKKTTYVYSMGDGNDFITVISDEDVVRLKDISPDQVSVSVGTDGLTLSMPDGGSIVLHSSGSPMAPADVEFDDGTIWSRDDLAARDAIAVKGTDLADTLSGTNADELFLAGAGDDTVYGGRGADTLYGGDGDDLLSDTYGSDANALYGEAGDDTLQTGDGDDTLSGGTGNDTLEAGDGVNTFLFEKGFGNDSIRFATGTDTAVLSGILSTMATYALDGSSLVVTIDHSDGTIDTLTIVDGAYQDGTRYGLESLVFDDRTVSMAETLALAATVYGTEGDDIMYGSDRVGDVLSGLGGNDKLHGYAGDDTLLGGDGADTLYGYDDTDVLDGGAGNDTLYGDRGDDVYVWSSGADQAYDTGGNDVLDMGAVDPASLVLTKQGDDLLVQVGDDTLVVQDQFRLSGYYLNRAIDEFRFQSGDVWGLDDISRKVSILSGTAGSDTVNGTNIGDFITGGDGDDALSGNAGGDMLDGGAGDDTLDGGVGDDLYAVSAGNDTITDSEGFDTLLAAVADFKAAARDGDDLLVKTTSGTTRVAGQFSAASPVIDQVRDEAAGAVLTASAIASLVDRICEFTAPDSSATDSLEQAAADDGYKALLAGFWA